MSQFGTFRPRIRNPFANEYLLRILTRDQAREVILVPAEEQNISYDPGLVERLLDDLGEQEINPPQLQLVCSALYDGLNGREQITQTMYEKAGEASGILKGHLERFLTQVPVPLVVAGGPARMQTVLLEVDSDTGRCLSIERRQWGRGDAKAEASP